MNRLPASLLLALIALFASACTLDLGAAATATPSLEATFPPPMAPVATQAPAVTIVVTQVSQVAVTQVAQIAVTQVAVFSTSAPVITCTTVPTGWLPYVIVPGDTLGILAILTFSSVTDLASANCITNPDLIYVDQTIYVPQAPGTFLPTAIPNATNLPVVDNILIEPAVVMNGIYTVTAGQVTVRAGTIANATSVTFYIAPIGVASTPTVIGTDNNLADGATATLQIGTAPIQANVWAIASGPNGEQLTSNPILVQANM